MQTASKAPRFTIGMPTFDDYDGVYFTIQSLRMFHADFCAQAEIVVVDNNPHGASAPALRDLGNHVPAFRYIEAGGETGSALAKQRVFDEARGEFVVCMDCHILIVPGALDRLASYFGANPQTQDLLQGPLLLDDNKTIQTHFDPVWSGGMYGTWGVDPRGNDPDGPPFDIPMQGMGLFACRRAAWPDFNPQFRGFGGEEFYIHEKFRQRGGRTICLPFLRWMHRFNRPLGVPYRNVWEDRIWNYVTGFTELGLPLDEFERHFCEHVGREFTTAYLASIRSN
jgi:glycosyltransferase involved in cell wall biosynthesis